MNTEIKNNIEKNIKIDYAYNNYHDIISKKLPYKFVYLNDWLLKKSKILKKEAELLEKKLKILKLKMIINIKHIKEEQ